MAPSGGESSISGRLTGGLPQTLELAGRPGRRLGRGSSPGVKTELRGSWGVGALIATEFLICHRPSMWKSSERFRAVFRSAATLSDVNGHIVYAKIGKIPI
jgi:hypothetical protein